MSIDLASRTLDSALTSAEITGYRSVLGQLLWLGQQSRPDLCVGVSLAAQKTAEPLSLISRRGTNWMTKRRAQHKWALSFENLFRRFVTQTLVSQTLKVRSPKVVWLLVLLIVKTRRFDLSTITCWQSSTIKRAVKPIPAAEGYAVSDGLESAQWSRHLLAKAHMARSSLKDVEKESLKRPALVFTDSDSLANTVKRGVGQRAMKRGSETSCTCSEKGCEQWETFCCSGCRHTCKSQTLIFVSLFNSCAFQSVAKKVYASRTATESV